MSKQGYIHKYTYPNGKVYIGQTRTSVKERHQQHMSASKEPARRCVCEIAMAKYGEPVLETIETIEVEDKESAKLVGLLNGAERKWIDKYDSANRANGYNREKWYEIFGKEGYQHLLGYVREVLESIVDKNGAEEGADGRILPFHLKSADLSKEERQVWYGEIFIGEDGRKMTFSSYEKFFFTGLII